MVPVVLISTTVFLALQLLQTHLSHSLSLSESSERIEHLESQLASLVKEQRRERKRMQERWLPEVVDRVLEKVGAKADEAKSAAASVATTAEAEVDEQAGKARSWWGLRRV